MLFDILIAFSGQPAWRYMSRCHLNTWFHYNVRNNDIITSIYNLSVYMCSTDSIYNLPNHRSNSQFASIAAYHNP